MTHKIRPLPLIALLLSSLLAVFATPAHPQGLPPQVEFDRLKRKVLDAHSVHDVQGTLKLVEQMHALESDDIRMPPAILFLEADLSASTRQYVRARQALQAYFDSGEKEGDLYERALRLFDVIEPKAAEEEKLAAVAMKVAEEDQRVLKNLKICEQVLSILGEYDSPGGGIWATFAKQRSRCPSPAKSLVPETHPQYARMVALQDAMQAKFRALSRSEAQKVFTKGEGKIGTGDQPITVVAIPVGDLQLKDGRKLHSDGFKIADHALSSCQIQFGYLELVDPSYDPESHHGCPVTNEQVTSFLSWLGEATGRQYRLPTEEEWEYAMRAGVVTEYPWGSSHSSGKQAKYEQQNNKFGISGAWSHWPELTANCHAKTGDGSCTAAKYVQRNIPTWGGMGEGRFADRKEVGARDEAPWIRIVEM